jgi:hypothetical protein
MPELGARKNLVIFRKVRLGLPVQFKDARIRHMEVPSVVYATASRALPRLSIIAIVPEHPKYVLQNAVVK